MLVHRKPVAAYDEDGQLIGQWKSTLEAAMENDGKPGYSKQVIKNCAGCRQRDCQMCFYFRKYRRTWKYMSEHAVQKNAGLKARPQSRTGRTLSPPAGRSCPAPAASSPPSRAAASASMQVFRSSQVPQSFPFCRVLYQNIGKRTSARLSERRFTYGLL